MKIQKITRLNQGHFWVSESVEYTPNKCGKPRRPRLADRFGMASASLRGIAHRAIVITPKDAEEQLSRSDGRAAMKACAREYASKGGRLLRAGASYNLRNEHPALWVKRIAGLARPGLAGPISTLP